MPTSITHFYEEKVEVIDLTMDAPVLNYRHHASMPDSPTNNVRGTFSILDFEAPLEGAGKEVLDVYNGSKNIHFLIGTKKATTNSKGKIVPRKKSNQNKEVTVDKGKKVQRNSKTLITKYFSRRSELL